MSGFDNTGSTFELSLEALNDAAHLRAEVRALRVAPGRLDDFRNQGASAAASTVPTFRIFLSDDLQAVRSKVAWRGLRRKRVSGSMTLSLVGRPWRRMPLKPEEPTIEIHRDCIYVPMNNQLNFWEDFSWGIYDANGHIIEAAAFCMLPNMTKSGQGEVCNLEISNLEYAPCDQYFYVGNIMNHYGHFVCSSMSRLWALPRFLNIPLVGHAMGDPTAWFSWSQTNITALFGSAGVEKKDFAAFDRPTRIRELVIAGPSFVELNYAHLIHSTSANRWGDKLVLSEDISSEIEAVYLSKEKISMQSGIINEAVLVEYFREAGVKIAYPETMSLPEQVALFQRAKRIIGQSSSAFHTSIFSASRPNQVFVILNHHKDFISDNHALIDAVNKNRSYYVYLEMDESKSSLYVKDPRASAKLIIDFAYSLVA